MNQTQSDVAPPHRRFALRVLGVLGVVVLVGGLVTAAPATAQTETSDAVRAWNTHAIAALANPTAATTPGAGQPPQVAALNMAMVHIAVFDAVNSIVGGYQPYLNGLPPAAPAASLDAAVATAAHDVLVGLGRGPVPALPQQVRDRLATIYANSLAAIPDGTSKDDGIAAGAAAAAAMLAERDGDGRYVPFAFTQGTGPGEWRPTSGVSDPFAWVAKVRPFSLDSSSQFRTGGPRQLGSAAYARDYDEVKALGSLTASSRNADQQALAEFYTTAPPELFNRAFRGLTSNEGLSLADEARFYAVINVAGADALIHCWDEKEHWSFWRPITAIQQGDADGNKNTVGDTNWVSFLTAPAYSDHTSGYNCYTAAAMHAAQEVFQRSKADFSVTNLVTGVTRQYERFSDVYRDTIEARIYQGLHFRSADVQGAELGKNVGSWVARHDFQPQQ